MENIFKLFKIEVIKDSIKRIQMDDATYFGPEYKDYISNSKLGLLNPAQGGSPQKFLEGFKSSKSNAFALGSAVHQVTLESNDYMLSDVTKPSGKLGDVYDKYMEYLSKGEDEEKSIVLAALDSNYYVNKIMNADCGQDLPSVLKTALVKINRFKEESQEKERDGKKLIYLPSDLYTKAKGCIKSLKGNNEIQKSLNWANTYCEDVIICDLLITFPKDFNNPDGEQYSIIVKVKIKIDNWTIDHVNKRFVLNDLKTTGKPVQYFMGYEVEEEGFMGEKTTIFKNGSFQNFHYSRQMAMYLFMLKLYINQEYGEGYTCSSNMLVVETVGAFNSAVFNVTNGMIKTGFEEFSELLKRVAYHQLKGWENIMELEATQDDFNI